MKQIFKSPSALTQGYYLMYVRSKTGKYIYVFQITDENMEVFKMILIEVPKESVSVFTTPRTLSRSALCRGRGSTIYELTENEFMLEISDLI
jgi:hypothetical protein